MKDSIHFTRMLNERGIFEKWVYDAMTSPDRVEHHEDGTTHYIKRILDYDGRWLRVVVNEQKVPLVKVTAFFDRRLRRKM